jgi:hypothetical protein
MGARNLGRACGDAELQLLDISTACVCFFLPTIIARLVVMRLATFKTFYFALASWFMATWCFMQSNKASTDLAEQLMSQW